MPLIVGRLVLVVTLALYTPWAAIAQEAAIVAEEEATAPQAEAPLTAVLAADLVTLVPNEAGDLVEVLEPADRAVPGDIIQYTGNYSNISEAPLVGLIINGPVPSSTSFVGGSQSTSLDAIFEVLIDGEDWQELPAFRTVVDDNGTEQRVEALPSDFQQLRWRLIDPLDVDATLIVIYRVAVDS